jgi:predicted small integral membrane protein
MDKIKEIIRTVVSYIDTKGFSAIASLGIGVVLWILGYKIFAGVAFGVFLTRNWSIFREIISKEIEDFRNSA